MVDKVRKYEEMNDWLFEESKQGTRLERMYDELDLEGITDLKKYANLMKWLEEAFNAGRDGE